MYASPSYSSGTSCSSDSGSACSTSSTFSNTSTPPVSAIITLRSDGAIQSISRGCDELFGFDSCELLGKRITLLIPDPYGEDFGPLPSYITSSEAGSIAVAAAAAAGKPTAVEQKRTLEGRHKTGALFSISLSVSELNIPGMSPMFIVVAERRETDEVYLTLSSSGQVLQVSRNCLAVFGYRDSELLRQPLAMLVPPPSAFGPPHEGAPLYGADSYVPLEQMTSPAIYAIRNLLGRHREDNQWFPISLQIRPILDAASPMPAPCDRLYHCKLQPVAEKEAAFTIDLCGLIENCNSFATLLFGYSEKELSRRHIGQIVPTLGKWFDSPCESTSSTTTDRMMATDMPTVVEMDVASTMSTTSTAPEDAFVAVGPGAGPGHNRKRSASSPAALETRNEPPKKRRRMSMSIDEPVTFDGMSTSIAAHPPAAPASAAASARRRNTIGVASPTAATVAAAAAVRTAACARRMSISGDDVALTEQVLSTPLTACHKDGSSFEVHVRLRKFLRPSAGGFVYGATFVRPRLASTGAFVNFAPPSPASPPAALLSATGMSTMSTAPTGCGMSAAPAAGVARPTTADGIPGNAPLPPPSPALGVAGMAPPPAGALPIECQFLLKEVVGRGNQGVVRRATCLRTGREVAIKVLQKDLMEPKDYRRYLLEVDILKKLDHPNITKLYDVVEEADRVYIVTEFIGGGELHERVVAHQPGALPESVAKRYFKQILSAVEYCHRHQIVHRDIKLKNILLDESAANVKMIDFGLSNFFAAGGDQLRSTFCGTPAFAAPEMCLAQRYIGPEVDLWSLGVCLYAMAVGQLPFKNVVSLVNADYAPIPSHLSAELKHVIQRLLVVDPKQRATVEELQSLPWLAKEE